MKFILSFLVSKCFSLGLRVVLFLLFVWLFIDSDQQIMWGHFYTLHVLAIYMCDLNSIEWMSDRENQWTYLRIVFFINHFNFSEKHECVRGGMKHLHVDKIIRLLDTVASYIAMCRFCRSARANVWRDGENHKQDFFARLKWKCVRMTQFRQSALEFEIWPERSNASVIYFWQLRLLFAIGMSAVSSCFYISIQHNLLLFFFYNYILSTSIDWCDDHTLL